MITIAHNIKLQFDEAGKPEFVISTSLQHQAALSHIAELKEIIGKGKQLDVEIKQYRKKRSLTANSYFWVLVDKIRTVLRTSQDEVYIQMLTRYGQREPQLLSVIEEGAPMVYRATNGHCVEVGESELNGKTFKHLAILIGSSEYDTKQMAVLIDGIVSECKGMDIETMSERELQSLKASWTGSAA